MHASGSTLALPPALSGCPVGVALLQKFHMCIEGLSQNVGEADVNHPLAAYAGDPTGCVEENKDVWAHKSVIVLPF